MKYFSKFYFLIAVIFLFFVNFLMFEAPSDFTGGELVNIEEGASLRSVSKTLFDKNIIKSRTAFETVVILFGGEKSIKPGEYFFDEGLGVFSVAERMYSGKRNLDPIKVTIPEGYDTEDMVEAYAKKLPNFKIDEFLAKAKDLEGYLFPDTYFFFNNENAEDVIVMMRKNFDKKVLPLLDQGMAVEHSPEDVIVMASIIEREASGDGDRNLISGILWKRLSIGMALQVDAWPETYEVPGLPQKPICNPGLESINAALFPEESDYLYYLHGKDGNTYYAENFDKHRQNKAKYLK